MTVGIITSLIAAGIVAVLSGLYRLYIGQRIKITLPGANEGLGNPETPGVYIVRGTLRRLPKGHEIWLLTEDESTKQVWPQGFFLPRYDESARTWYGKVNATGRKHLRIIAVVASPTSQDLFRYFQNVGRLRNNTFEPLTRSSSGMPQSGLRANLHALMRGRHLMPESGRSLPSQESQQAGRSLTFTVPYLIEDTDHGEKEGGEESG